MSQYRLCFSTTRIPGKEEDRLRHYVSDSKHIAVLYKGVWSRLDAFDNFNQLCTPHELQEQLAKLIASIDQGEASHDGEGDIGALTCINRTEWAGAPPRQRAVPRAIAR